MPYFSYLIFSKEDDGTWYWNEANWLWLGACKDAGEEIIRI